MDNGFPSVPGFRSLAQAGIRLREGLPVVNPSSGAPLKQGKPPVEDPPWPTVPAPSGGGGSSNTESSWPEVVSVTPRAPGTRRPVPRDQRGEDTKAGGTAPNGIYVGTLPALRFACPCCATVLTVPNPEVYHGEPGPCPHCAAVVLPPRVVSPFAKAKEEAGADGKSRHYSGFLL